GAALGLARAAGFRPGMVISSVMGAAAALAGSNGPMTALGITDPRTRSRTDQWSTVGGCPAVGAAVRLACQEAVVHQGASEHRHVGGEHGQPGVQFLF